ncbi:helix-turn-helix domain-containing protein [Pseudonocardia endophytica]|uniref:Helix-turn-helix protein n=1 Tax=Pseudonocardia endophytica TaxID=401976 RepID=A0A4R1I0V2_PSEEN|nr:helix-turn-helix transcriptional regulator [Pseudonocardia endophytica]TCK27531.1 helix-turn-helix protein [Pseudonocardia endophytica]
MAGNTEFRDFLASRRSRITPERAGLAAKPGTRRVPGLRREEVAELAGLSVDYYVRLERGRATNPSASVLDGIARALRLDEAERAHLFDLAGVTPDAHRARRNPPQRPHPGLLRVLDTIEHVPAMIFGRRMDVLAANRLARALIIDFDALPLRDRNIARFVFLDPAARTLYPDWAAVAEDIVYGLRLDAGRDPHDPRLTELVGELTVADPDFGRWWSTHDVRRRTGGVKRFRHPIVGALTLHYDRLTVPDVTDQRLSIYSPEPGSESAQALRLLGDWTAADPAPQAPGPGHTVPDGSSITEV